MSEVVEENVLLTGNGRPCRMNLRIMKRLISALLMASLTGCVNAQGWPRQTGHLVVTMTDRLSGEPITNATVTVRTLNVLGINAGANETHYTRTSAMTSTNGVADVEFSFRSPHFTWWVSTPSHHSRGLGVQDGFFNCEVEQSEYYNCETNTVEGLERYNELVALQASGDVEGYAAKFEPTNVTYVSTTIRQSLSFYPRMNTRPMVAYGEDADSPLPVTPVTIVTTNGVEAVQYPVVEFDLKECSVVPSETNDSGEVPSGRNSDMKIVRYRSIVNGVKTYFGYIEFNPGGGAYVKTQTGDSSFPSTYSADTNEVYVTRIPYSYRLVDGRFVDDQTLLRENEYMVIRTRVVKDASDSIASCNYAKIVGPLSVGEDLIFGEIVFNPKANDPNLEFEIGTSEAGEKACAPRWP